jgi:hypothetical protein
MVSQPSSALVAALGICFLALVTFSDTRDPSSPGAPAPSASPAKHHAMMLDQENTAVWKNAWTNVVNDVQQSFTPSLPKLAAAEVELVLANPGPPEDALTMTVMDSGGRSMAVVSKTVAAADCAQVLFVFRNGGVKISPGQLYSLRLSGGATFGWKYVVGGYENGSASFNGQPLLRDARSTFLFKTFGTK